MAAQLFPEGHLPRYVHVYVTPRFNYPASPHLADRFKQSGRCSDCAYGYDGVREELLYFPMLRQVTSNRPRTRVMCV